ncbi:MAG: hypothetical protein NTZ56_17230 [Acidobacteria bacterium]|nr:hypothetical protein [Acidobacteriota bacterium]
MSLFRIEHAEDFVGSVGRFLITKRAGIKRDNPAEKFRRKGALVFRR